MNILLNLILVSWVMVEPTLNEQSSTAPNSNDGEYMQDPMKEVLVSPERNPNGARWKWIASYSNATEIIDPSRIEIRLYGEDDGWYFHDRGIEVLIDRQSKYKISFSARCYPLKDIDRKVLTPLHRILAKAADKKSEEPKAIELKTGFFEDYENSKIRFDYKRVSGFDYSRGTVWLGPKSFERGQFDLIECDRDQSGVVVGGPDAKSTFLKMMVSRAFKLLRVVDKPKE